MKSDPMRPLARRLLKCALRRHVYLTIPDETTRGLAFVENGLYSDLQSEWAKVVEEGGKLTDPVYRESVLNLLREALLEARVNVEGTFESVGFDGKTEVKAFVGAFQPEAYLP